jgi:hypothetical protein
MMKDAPINALMRAVEVLEEQERTLLASTHLDVYEKPKNPYHRSSLFQIQTDAASIRKLAQTLCEHPYDYYNPELADDGEGEPRKASCEACGRVWPLGSERDDEKMGVAQR